MYIEITDPSELEDAFELSEQSPLLLFLFDPHCPINTRAKNELDGLTTTDVYLVDVARRHALGVAVQLATGVRHESPQVLVLSDRAPQWHASHGQIKAGAVRDALTAAGA